MSHQKTEAIVLKKIPYADGDWVITFLTKEGARLTGFAPKGRLSKKRFGGVLDLFNLLQIHFKDGKDMVRLEEVELIEGMNGVRKDLAKFATISYFTEMILTFLPEKDNLSLLFEDYLSFLRQIDGSSEPPSYHIPLMEHYLLKLFGFKPGLTHCLVCQSPVRQNEHYYFNSLKGGLVCSTCNQKSDFPTWEQRSYPLSSEVIQKLLREQKTRPSQWEKDGWKPSHVNEARKAFEFFIQYTAGKPLKSLMFLTRILQ